MRRLEVMLSTLMRATALADLPTDLHCPHDLARKCQWNGKPAIEDARVRAHVADAFLLQHGVELIIARGLTALSKGKAPGPEMSITKLVAAKAMQDISSFALELAGPEGALSHESIGQDWNYMQRLWLGAPGARVAGGTDEVMKNVIAAGRHPHRSQDTFRTLELHVMKLDCNRLGTIARRRPCRLAREPNRSLRLVWMAGSGATTFHAAGLIGAHTSRKLGTGLAQLARPPAACAMAALGSPIGGRVILDSRLRPQVVEAGMASRSRSRWPVRANMFIRQALHREGR
jgi:hypothetical protein